MSSEGRTDGEIGIDDITTSAPDAAGVGTLTAQRADAARVWTATRDSPEHADVVAASGADTQAVLDELSNEIDRLHKENAATGVSELAPWELVTGVSH